MGQSHVSIHNVVLDVMSCKNWFDTNLASRHVGSQVESKMREMFGNHLGAIT